MSGDRILHDDGVADPVGCRGRRVRIGGGKFFRDRNAAGGEKTLGVRLARRRRRQRDVGDLRWRRGGRPRERVAEAAHRSDRDHGACRILENRNIAGFVLRLHIVGYSPDQNEQPVGIGAADRHQLIPQHFSEHGRAGDLSKEAGDRFVIALPHHGAQELIEQRSVVDDMGGTVDWIAEGRKGQDRP